MHLTKAQLIEQIEQIPSDEFEVMFGETKPAMSYDLPDVRTGAIYTPRTVQKQTLITPGELRIEIVTKYLPEK